MPFSEFSTRESHALQNRIGYELPILCSILLVLTHNSASAEDVSASCSLRSCQTESYLPIHEWYPTACCMDIDCAPVSAKRIRKTPLGWHLLDTDEIIGFSDRRIRKSLDLRFHRCVHEFWQKNSPTRCLFVPGPGI